jgi:hypothetical protein
MANAAKDQGVSNINNQNNGLQNSVSILFRTIPKNKDVQTTTSLALRDNPFNLAFPTADHFHHPKFDLLCSNIPAAGEGPYEKAGATPARRPRSSH